MKTCTACGKDRPISFYYKAKTGKDGLMGKCKDCHNLQSSTKQALRRNHAPINLTCKELADLRHNHSGVCDICGSVETKYEVSQLIIDHCHDTGKFRGFLCVTCNVGLGKLGDTKEGLLRALRYLENAD